MSETHSTETNMTEKHMTETDVTGTHKVRVARNALLFVFFLNGMLATSWFSRLPEVKNLLHLSSGLLGTVLLAVSVGALTGLPLAGRLANRWGTGVTVRIGAVIGGVGFSMAALSTQFSAVLVFPVIGLFVCGFGIGVWDVAQNLEGSIVEQKTGRAIMPWFHAAFSMGTVVGALLAALAIWLHVPVGIHVFLFACMSVVCIWIAAGRFIGEPKPATVTAPTELSDRPKRQIAWLEPRTLLIGVVIFVAAFTEGSAGDWIPLAFVEGHTLSELYGVFALATFLTFMTAGRIVGTAALDKWGRVWVLRVLFTAAIVGSLLVVFGGVVGAFIGAALWGVGSSLGYPVGISAAADDPTRAAVRISVVATMGSIAFLCGPPLIGFVADSVGVLRALLIVGALAIVGLFFVPVVKKPTS